jgi:hypothetical protein
MISSYKYRNFNQSFSVFIEVFNLLDHFLKNQLLKTHFFFFLYQKITITYIN